MDLASCLKPLKCFPIPQTRPFYDFFALNLLLFYIFDLNKTIKRLVSLLVSAYICNLAFVDASMHLFKRVYLSICPSNCPSIQPSVYLPIHMSFSLFVCPSVCPCKTHFFQFGKNDKKTIHARPGSLVPAN